METEPLLSPWVIKVGGSLFDLPDLGPRLVEWLLRLETRQIVLIAGGGPVVDVVRALDARHGLGEEKAHWLALAALTLTSRFLAELVPGSAVIDAVERCPTAWSNQIVPVLDGYAFARADEGQAGCLPHAWAVTSDSLAARVARVLGARRLILLKSATLPVPADWSEAGRRGFVDPYFAQAAQDIAEVEVVNFRLGGV
jgi:5-(aminomethyl)-3-furanmethanol phosphate kinase